MEDLKENKCLEKGVNDEEDDAVAKEIVFPTKEAWEQIVWGSFDEHRVTPAKEEALSTGE